MFQIEIEKICSPPLYSAPEAFIKIEGKISEEKFHVWNIGLILFEMLTQTHLYYYQVGETEKTFTKSHLKLSLESIRAKGVKFPQIMGECWKRLIKFMMVYESDKRPSFADSKEKLYK